MLLIVTIAYLPINHAEFGKEAAGDSTERFLQRCHRVSLWALIIASVVTAGSMLISMLPVLDTPGRWQAALVHRYSGLLVIAMVFVHAIRLLLSRRGKPSLSGR